MHTTSSPRLFFFSYILKVEFAFCAFSHLAIVSMAEKYTSSNTYFWLLVLFSLFLYWIIYLPLRCRTPAMQTMRYPVLTLRWMRCVQHFRRLRSWKFAETMLRPCDRNLRRHRCPRWRLTMSKLSTRRLTPGTPFPISTIKIYATFWICVYFISCCSLFFFCFCQANSVSRSYFFGFGWPYENAVHCD